MEVEWGVLREFPTLVSVGYTGNLLTDEKLRTEYAPSIEDAQKSLSILRKGMKDEDGSCGPTSQESKSAQEILDSLEGVCVFLEKTLDRTRVKAVSENSAPALMLYLPVAYGFLALVLAAELARAKDKNRLEGKAKIVNKMVLLLLGRVCAESVHVRPAVRKKKSQPHQTRNNAGREGLVQKMKKKKKECTPVPPSTHWRKATEENALCTLESSNLFMLAALAGLLSAALVHLGRVVEGRFEPATDVLQILVAVTVVKVHKGLEENCVEELGNQVSGLLHFYYEAGLPTARALASLVEAALEELASRNQPLVIAVPVESSAQSVDARVPRSVLFRSDNSEMQSEVDKRPPHIWALPRKSVRFDDVLNGHAPLLGGLQALAEAVVVALQTNCVALISGQLAAEALMAKLLNFIVRVVELIGIKGWSRGNEVDKLRLNACLSGLLTATLKIWPGGEHVVGIDDEEEEKEAAGALVTSQESLAEVLTCVLEKLVLLREPPCVALVDVGHALFKYYMNSDISPTTQTQLLETFGAYFKLLGHVLWNAVLARARVTPLHTLQSCLSQVLFAPDTSQDELSHSASTAEFIASARSYVMRSLDPIVPSLLTTCKLNMTQRFSLKSYLAEQESDLFGPRKRSATVNRFASSNRLVGALLSCVGASNVFQGPFCLDFGVDFQDDDVVAKSNSWLLDGVEHSTGRLELEFYFGHISAQIRVVNERAAALNPESHTLLKSFWSGLTVQLKSLIQFFLYKPVDPEFLSAAGGMSLNSLSTLLASEWRLSEASALLKGLERYLRSGCEHPEFYQVSLQTQWQIVLQWTQKFLENLGKRVLEKDASSELAMARSASIKVLEMFADPRLLSSEYVVQLIGHFVLQGVKLADNLAEVRALYILVAAKAVAAVNSVELSDKTSGVGSFSSKEKLAVGTALAPLIPSALVQLEMATFSDEDTLNLPIQKVWYSFLTSLTNLCASVSEKTASRLVQGDTCLKILNFFEKSAVRVQAPVWKTRLLLLQAVLKLLASTTWGRDLTADVQKLFLTRTSLWECCLKCASINSKVRRRAFKGTLASVKLLLELDDTGKELLVVMAIGISMVESISTQRGFVIACEKLLEEPDVCLPTDLRTELEELLTPAQGLCYNVEKRTERKTSSQLSHMTSSRSLGVSSIGSAYSTHQNHFAARKSSKNSMQSFKSRVRKPKFRKV